MDWARRLAHFRVSVLVQHGPSSIAKFLSGTATFPALESGFTFPVRASEGTDGVRVGELMRLADTLVRPT
jgi:hypothetical protein